MTEKAKREVWQAEVQQAMKEVSGTQAGRLLLWYLIDSRAGAFRDCFSGEQTHRAAYLEGRRSVALEVVRELQAASPPNYVRMLSEASQRREREQQARELAKRERTDGG